MNTDSMKKRRMVSQMAIILLFFLFFSYFLYHSYWYLFGISQVKSSPVITEVQQKATKIPMKQLTRNKRSFHLYERRPDIGEQYGAFSISSLGLHIPVYYGANPDQLKIGIGQIERTALPGENNNTILSGHRDTVFRQLEKVAVGDVLSISTYAGQFTYKVRKIRIVDKDDRTVIVPKPKATLTVITCYPFGFFGHAPKRYVIIADLVKGATR